MAKGMSLRFAIINQVKVWWSLLLGVVVRDRPLTRFILCREETLIKGEITCQKQ